MRAAIALLLLAGCNQILGIDDPVVGDDVAAPDARPDGDLPPDGAGLSCDEDITCPDATGNLVTVCGRYVDLATELSFRSPQATGLACDGGGFQSGPCELQLGVYDAANFVAGPTGATPLVAEEYYVDDCGRYYWRNVQRPSSGSLVVTLAGPNRPLTATPRAVVGGNSYNQLAVYTFDDDTRNRWFQAVNLDFVTQGGFVAMFRAADGAHAGVTLTIGGQSQPNNTYYFTDQDPTAKQEMDGDGPANDERAGPNGTAVVTGVTTVQSFSGTGGEPPGCTWENALGAAPRGAILVQRVRAVDGQNNPCL